MTTQTTTAELNQNMAAAHARLLDKVNEQAAMITRLQAECNELADLLATVSIERDDLHNLVAKLNRQLTAENRVVAVVLSDHAGKPLHATI